MLHDMFAVPFGEIAPIAEHIGRLEVVLG